MPDKPISPETADVMIEGYFDYMQNLGVDMSKQTQSVSFGKATVMAWLTGAMRNADELRIFMGLYPAGHTNEGRSTVILWPYLNGKPVTDGSGTIIDPYNEGGGLP